MAIDNKTANLGYLKPHPDNKMKSEDLPRLITTLDMIDEDMATVVAEILGKAPLVHEHEMGAIVGLFGALSGKAALVHNHSIGGLQGVDFSGAATGQFAKFNGSLWIPAFIQAADLANKIITNAKLRDSDPLTIMGRAAASIGSPADISATANDRLLARVSDALAFVQLSLGMVPDGLLTLAKLASSSIASAAEYSAMTASKVITTDAVKAASAYVKPLAISSGAVAWNMSDAENFSITATGDFTLNSPSGTIPGKKVRIVVTMGGAGNYAMALGTSIKTRGGIGIALAGDVGAVTVVYLDCASSTTTFASAIEGVE
jgi:hypothetical protein